MFTRSRNLNPRRKYKREFFETFVSRLVDAGFNDIRVILPHNYESVDPEESIESVREFLGRERNFAAIILRANNSERNETLKVLFVNSDTLVFFNDDTFPSSESAPPKIFFQSPDPARVYALSEYFYEYLSEPSIRDWIIGAFALLLSISIIIIEVVSIITQKKGTFQIISNASFAWDIIFISITLILAYKANIDMSGQGLWIKAKKDPRIIYYTKAILRGEYRDNPLTQLIITVIGGIIVAIILKIFGIL